MLRRALVWLLVCCVVLLVVPSATLLVVAIRLEHHLHRIDNVFSGLHERPSKPAGTAADAVNILLLAAERRGDAAVTGAGAGNAPWAAGLRRPDAVMLLHIDADRRSAQLVSIPGDSWVDIPGHGMNRIDAAFRSGRPALAVETVEHLTSVRIDHLAVMDWTGFKALTDALGGVDVDIPRTVHDRAGGLTWTAGRHHLSGDQALDYLDLRDGHPAGAVGRIRRQQAFLQPLMQDSLHQEMRTNPKLLYRFLDTVSQHLSVDSDWSLGSMVKLIVSLRNLRSAHIDYTIAPVSGTGIEGRRTVVHLAPKAAADLWAAVRSDTMGQWDSAHPRELAGAAVE